MILDIIIPFIVVGLAELGDKSQICIFLMSSKTNKHVQVFLGAVAAFIIVDGIAIAFGSWAAGLVPMRAIRVISGAAFMIIGILIFRGRKGNGRGGVGNVKKPFLSTLSLIFITEFGDKTQISSGLLSAAYDPVLVMVGVISALSLLSAIAILFGRLVSDRLDKSKVSAISAAAFVIMGLAFVLM
jgi:putative Ca2+/H+ antiporter (TMEM165/GDT1 family)